MLVEHPEPLPPAGGGRHFQACLCFGDFRKDHVCLLGSDRSTSSVPQVAEQSQRVLCALLQRSSSWGPLERPRCVPGGPVPGGPASGPCVWGRVREYAARRRSQDCISYEHGRRGDFTHKISFRRGAMFWWARYSDAARRHLEKT